MGPKKLWNAVLLICLISVLFSACRRALDENVSSSPPPTSSNASQKPTIRSFYHDVIEGDDAGDWVERYIKSNKSEDSTSEDRYYFLDNVVECEGELYYQIQCYINDIEKGYGSNPDDGFWSSDPIKPVGDPYYVDIYSGEVYEANEMTIGEQRIISMSEAEILAYESYGYGDPRNLFSCEGLYLKDEKLKYEIRGYNLLPEHRTTFMWYVVDLYTGEVEKNLP